MSRLTGIKADGVESITRDVLLRSANPDAVPVPVGFVPSPGFQQLLHLFRRCGTAGERIAAWNRPGHRAWMEFHRSSRIPMEIFLSEIIEMRKMHPGRPRL